MTRKLSLTTAVAVAALSVGAPAAFGEGRLAGSVEPVLAQPDPMIEDGFAQAIAKQAIGVGTYRDAHERGVATEPQWRAVPPQGSVQVSATSSGTEIEWPQVGVGLGIVLLLALGLGLIMRVVHTRPFAH